ncbi:hypothetical protein [Geodermatophilus sp. URMC 63]
MDVRSPFPVQRADTSSLADRANAVLREEIASGALANIAAASRVWSASRRDLVAPEITRRLAAEVGGLLDTVLDLLAPLPRIPAAAALLPDLGYDRPSQEQQQPLDPVLFLRARRPAPPGGRAEIRTTLRNDGPAPVEIAFLWDDLLSDRGDRIRASCLRLLPGRVHVAAGAFADLLIGLDVPDDARPGLYHAALQAPGLTGLRALLTFPVEPDVDQEASIVR